MQCTAGYPPEFEELNLRVIETYRERFPDIVIGFSSHDNGISMALVAYMLGSRMVEKHFTINRAWKGSDQAFSLERDGMRRMVRDLHRARISIGDGVKRVYPSEAKPLQKMAKKIVAARDLPSGHVLRREDLALKSPNDGLPPYELDNLIGRRLRGWAQGGREFALRGGERDVGLIVEGFLSTVRIAIRPDAERVPA